MKNVFAGRGWVHEISDDSESDANKYINLDFDNAMQQGENSFKVDEIVVKLANGEEIKLSDEDVMMQLWPQNREEFGSDLRLSILKDDKQGQNAKLDF